MQIVCKFIEAPLCSGTALAGTTGERSSRLEGHLLDT